MLAIRLLTVFLFSSTVLTEDMTEEQPIFQHGSASEYEAVPCATKRFQGFYFPNGTVDVVENVSKESTCAFLCWKRTNVDGLQCSSVNYLHDLGRCEFIDVPAADLEEVEIESYLTRMSSSIHIIPMICVSENTADLNASRPYWDTPITTQGANSDQRTVKNHGTRRGTQRSSCGRSYVRARSLAKIIGGSYAKPNSHPWVVSLQMKGMHFCGGALLPVRGNSDQSDIVITAAHCVISRRITVVAGIHSLKNPSSGQRVSSKRIYKHRSYSSRTNQHDIAIIVLEKPIKFSRTTQPVCLPSQGASVRDGMYLYAVGWGNTKEGGRSSSELMEVAVPVVSSSRCSADYARVMKIFPNEMLCAGEKGKDSCQGDSGGPLMMRTGGAFVLHGLVSFGIGCGRDKNPGVYTRVASYVSWINQQIGSMSSLRL